MLITCSQCQSKIRVPDSAAGRKGKCPKCSFVLTIPAAPAEPAPGEGITTTTPAARSVRPPAMPAREEYAEEVEEEPPRRRQTSDEDDEDESPRSRRRSDDDDEDDEDYTRKRIRKRVRRRNADASGLSLASMIVGIFSAVSSTVGCLCCGLFSTPITLVCAGTALVLGVMGRSRGSPNFALTGIICGAVALVFVLLQVIAVFALGGLQILGNMNMNGGNFKF